MWNRRTSQKDQQKSTTSKTNSLAKVVRLPRTSSKKVCWTWIEALKECGKGTRKRNCLEIENQRKCFKNHLQHQDSIKQSKTLIHLTCIIPNRTWKTFTDGQVLTITSIWCKRRTFWKGQKKRQRKRLKKSKGRQGWKWWRKSRLSVVWGNGINDDVEFIIINCIGMIPIKG